jgi:two-component sensor histidine kinase
VKRRSSDFTLWSKFFPSRCGRLQLTTQIALIFAPPGDRIRFGSGECSVGIGKLSRRLFLLTLVALIPAAIVLFYNLYSIQVAKEEEVHDEALRAAQLGALEMQRIVSGAENVLIALSAAPVIQRQDDGGCQAYLRRAGTRLPQFSGIVVADAHGIVICRQAPDGSILSLADMPYFKEALGTGRFVAGEYSIGRISSEAMLPLALPIHGDDNKAIGVIVGGLSLDWLGQRLHERNFAEKSALTVTDRAGTILARAPTPGNLVGTRISERVLRVVGADRPGTFKATGTDGIERIIGYYPVSAETSGLFVTAGISTDEAYGTIRRASWISLVVTLASLFLSFLLAWLTSAELIRRPVGKLIATIENWRSGDDAARTGMSERGGEFGVVGKAIDDFLGELVAARQNTVKAEAQRELLVHELDHRIKNLLATVQSLARQTFKDSARFEDAIPGFTRRLAAMSEAHGLLMKDNWRSAGMRALVAAATSPFTSEAAPQFVVTGPDFQVKAKAVLSLSMALHELCTNAVKYGALKNSEGRVHIDWAIGSNDERPDGDIFRLTWTEKGGPVVHMPEKFGFGSRMIERVLGYDLEAAVETKYLETGVTCTLVAPLKRIRAEGDKDAAA